MRGTVWSFNVDLLDISFRIEPTIPHHVQNMLQIAMGHTLTAGIIDPLPHGLHGPTVKKRLGKLWAALPR